MNSLVFRVVARLLMPIMFLFSLFITLRGHNDAGGGFIGGLVSGAALMIYALAFDTTTVLRMLPLSPVKIIASGLMLSLFSTLLALAFRQPAMTSVWFDRLGMANFGTPGIFDIGVFLVVVGTSLKILLPLLEETES